MNIFSLAGWTTDMWSPIINLFSFIPNFGWMIIVFTICLKLILSPLDFWQRKVSRQTIIKQQRMQPELQKIQKLYGNNQQLLNQKTMELYKRENFNVMGSCFSMLINMALTLFIFLTLFYGLMGLSQQNILNQYETLKNSYNSEFSKTYNIENNQEAIYLKENELLQNALTQAQTELGADATEEELNQKQQEIFYNEIKPIQEAVLLKYNEIKDSWLWVKSVWRPDTSASSFPDYQSFVSLSNYYNSSNYLELINGKNDEEIKSINTQLENQYNTVTNLVQVEYSSWNGYFILVILAAVISYFSMVVTQMQSTKKKNNDNKNLNEMPQKTGMKVMRFILPLIMVIFTIGYNAAFALYIVINSLMPMILSLVFLKIFEEKEKKQKITIKDKNKPEYSR